MPKFILTVARDATAYFTATVEADDLEQLKTRLGKYGYEPPDETPYIKWESSFQ